MSLELQNRQRAMLREMGLRVWSPQPSSAPPPTLKSAPAPSSESVAVVDSVTPTLKKEQVVCASEFAASIPLSWCELREAVMQCQRCKQSVGRRAAVFAQAEPGPVDWLVLGEPPDDTEERHGQAIIGQAGLLLDNMLKAVGVARSGGGGVELAKGSQRRAYVSNVVKCRPAIMRNPDAHDLASCESHLRREVALLQPKVILALGRFAAQAVLQGNLPEVASIPLGKLRGQVYRYQGIPVIVSYHPSYLLRTPQDKGRAWLDLCLAMQQIEPGER